MADFTRVRVVLVDTGIDLEHPGFRGRRVVVGPSFAPEVGADAADARVHGTWVGVTILSLASEVELVSVAVRNGSSSGDVARLIDGLRAALALAPDLIHVSVAAVSHERRDEIADVVGTAIAKGIRIVAPETEAGAPSYPGSLAGVDAVVADGQVPRELPARRPHGARQAWFASPFAPISGGEPPPAELTAECLATANVTGFLARLRRR